MTAATTIGERVGSLGQAQCASRLDGAGLPIRIGPFHAHIRVPVRGVQGALYTLYADYPLIDEANVFSFHALLVERRDFPRLHRRMVRFKVDGRVPHEDFPAAQALPVLEWGINLVIALRSHCFLMLHSAVLERSGRALLLPAAPGFGKTTLCAALAHRGWRLLSDEFGLIRPGTRDFIAVPRPMALKNESIDVIRSFAPEAVIGPSTANTRKGTVAHVKPPAGSVANQHVPARARWIVFPRWEPDARLLLQPLSIAESFMLLAMNAFNYELLGEAAFRTVHDVISGTDCYRLVYSDLDAALAGLEQLARNDERP